MSNIYRLKYAKNQEKNATLLDYGSGQAVAGNQETRAGDWADGLLLFDLALHERLPEKRFDLKPGECYPIVFNTMTTESMKTKLNRARHLLLEAQELLMYYPDLQESIEHVIELIDYETEAEKYRREL